MTSGQHSGTETTSDRLATPLPRWLGVVLAVRTFLFAVHLLGTATDATAPPSSACSVPS